MIGDDEPFEAPDKETIEELTMPSEKGGFDLKPEKVKGWGKAKALMVLGALHRERRILIRRNDVRAAKASGTMARGQPSHFERVLAAQALEEALLTEGPDEILHLLLYSSHVWADDEVRRFAGYFVTVLRGESALKREVAA